MQKQPASVLVPNLNELEEAPFLKKQTHLLANFKDKQKYLPHLRSLSYRYAPIMSKIFLFTLKQDRKGKKITRHLEYLTEKEIITVQQLFQLLNENLNQTEFSQEVQKIKEVQMRVYQLVNERLSGHLLEFGDKNYLNFGVYRCGDEFYIKAAFKHFNYDFKFDHDEVKKCEEVRQYRIAHYLVKQQLLKKYSTLEQMSYSMPMSADLPTLYSAFYEQAYFMYDEFILQLQVFNNYPLLRIKNYLPIKFIDPITEQPLIGPIFSSSHQECMYGHFTGYNANTIKQVQGQLCQQCQIVIDQLQQNEMLMMLRDNVANPEGFDIFYCPEHNRFKLWRQVKKIIECEGQINEEKEIVKTEIRYLNYYHFRINCKKMSTKQRIGFNSIKLEQSFPLTYHFLSRTMLIMDPARGKYCQHYAFTDLRLYYSSYNAQTNTYTCPIEGCNQTMPDGDIQYLREVQVLIEYAKFKCEENTDLLDCSKIVVQNNQKKLYLSYKVREFNTITTKIQQIQQYYKTLVDPYVPFPEYTLGMKEKERKAKMQEYMFAGMREEAMQAQEDQIEEQDEY